MRIFAFLPLLLLAPTMSADEVTVWPSARLQAYAAELAPKVNDQQYALERLEDFGSHYVMMVHRLDDGPAEVHDAVTDFYVVQGGTGTLHFGGTVVDGKVTEPGEIRGASLKGSQTRKLAAGDVVNIPPKLPHQIVLAPGETLTYMIVKVHAK